MKPETSVMSQWHYFQDDFDGQPGQTHSNKIEESE
jgi:hypothetical protein